MGIGAARVSRGEVALIIAAIGLESKLLSQDMFSVVVVVTVSATGPKDVLANYSNYGAGFVDIAAVGGDNRLRCNMQMKVD